MSKTLYSFVRELCPQCQVDWTLVEPYLQLKEIHKGDFLFLEGDNCSCIGLTEKGCLRTFFLKDGKELTLFFHLEYHTFGDYESWRKHTPACFSCQALENSEVLIITKPAIEVLEKQPDGQKLLRLVVENLAFQLRDRLLSLYRDSVEQRYLNLINSKPQLCERIPQYYLASYLGIEPESLSRLKRRMHQKNSLT